VNLILNIDTAVVSASVCLGRDGEPLAQKINPTQKDHAAWLHTAISELLAEQGISLSQLDAIAVSAGPGSYTGLRVGMATAKGLCYALKKPLIAINTLEMMAAGVEEKDGDSLLCPMIDARRMEVFTAVYRRNGDVLMEPTNLILTEDSYSHLLQTNRILFFGNGSGKFAPLLSHPHASFQNREATAEQMAALSDEKFRQKQFADLAYTEPFYGKDFYLPGVKPS
jgi:tRNA threonylcarbamoyladenosine biosynthesis protein TsaB